MSPIALSVAGVCGRRQSLTTRQPDIPSPFYKKVLNKSCIRPCFSQIKNMSNRYLSHSLQLYFNTNTIQLQICLTCPWRGGGHCFVRGVVARSPWRRGNEWQPVPRAMTYAGQTSGNVLHVDLFVNNCMETISKTKCSTQNCSV